MEIRIMLWNLSFIEKDDQLYEFCLKSKNGKCHYIKSSTPEELRKGIKNFTMDEIEFFENIYSNPLELNLRNVFSISYFEIKDIYNKLGYYADFFEICLDCLVCKLCDEKFTDYRSCVYHIERKKNKA
jgi:hypothetical protein